MPSWSSAAQVPGKPAPRKLHRSFTDLRATLVKSDAGPFTLSYQVQVNTQTSRLCLLPGGPTCSTQHYFSMDAHKHRKRQKTSDHKFAKQMHTQKLQATCCQSPAFGQNCGNACSMGALEEELLGVTAAAQDMSKTFAEKKTHGSRCLFGVFSACVSLLDLERAHANTQLSPLGYV